MTTMNSRYIVACVMMVGSCFLAPLRAITHYMGFSLTGAEANTLGASVQTKAGAAAQIDYVYSGSVNQFFFDMALGVGYQELNMGKASHIDSRSAVDRTGEEHLYQYRYTDIREQHRNLNGQLRLMVGGQVTDFVYLGVGAKLHYAFMRQASIQDSMATVGVYDRFAADYIANRPQYGFYPKATYSSSPSPTRLALTVVPSLEVGARLPMSQTSCVRIGAYLDVALPLSAPQGMITDYSAVDINPQTQNESNLRQNLKIRSLIDSDSARSLYVMEVGIRFTFLFRLYRSHYPCHCFPD